LTKAGKELERERVESAVSISPGLNEKAGPEYNCSALRELAMR
jgi:hypothetical protein